MFGCVWGVSMKNFFLALSSTPKLRLPDSEFLPNVIAAPHAVTRISFDLVVDESIKRCFCNTVIWGLMACVTLRAPMGI